MNLTSKSQIKSLLKKYSLSPSKGLGQNFLLDKTAVRKIIEAADLKPKDIVVEIGPGLGVLTQELAKKVYPVKSPVKYARSEFNRGISSKTKLFNRAGKVIAVEKDPKIATILRETLKDYKNIEIVEEDILKFQILNYKLQINSKLQIPNYKVVANLPFYLTAPVIRKFLESPVQPESMSLVIQKEVAQRICASPPQVSSKFGRARPPKMNLLAVSVQFYAEAKIISYISKKSFWPQPKVNSAIIKLKAKSEKRKVDNDLFFKIVKAGFSQPRKLLINNLSKNLKADKITIMSWLWKNNIRPNQRAETLAIEDWINLTKSFKINK